MFFQPEVFDLFIFIVAFGYNLLFKQFKFQLFKKEELDELLKESNRFKEELAIAEKANDKKKIDELIQQQEKTIKKSFQLSIEMIKNALIISIIFIIVMKFLVFFSPYEKDDIVITNLNQTEDKLIAEYHLSDSANKGTWKIEAFEKNGFFGDEIIAEDYFFVDEGNKLDVKFMLPPLNNRTIIMVDKENRTYTGGENLKIYIMKNTNYNPDNISVKLDNGTALLWRLPFTIPILDLTNITDVQGAFIISVIIIGYCLAIIEKILSKIKEVGNHAETKTEEQKHEKDLQTSSVRKSQNTLQEAQEETHAKLRSE